MRIARIGEPADPIPASAPAAPIPQKGGQMNKKGLVDFAERVGATFAQAFLALAVVSNMSDVHAVEAAAVAGALAAGKFALVKANAFLSSPSA